MTDKKCPKCGGELKTTEDNPFYHMCHNCVQGWTTEELEGIRRYKEWLNEPKTVTGKTISDPTYEFIINTIAAMRDFLRSDTDLLEQGCGLYDENENQATYDALFATLNNGLWGLGK